MKTKFFVLLTILSLMVTALSMSPAPVKAAAYGTTFTTSITYQNIDPVAGPATISLDFYQENSSTPVHITLNPLNQYAASSVFVGGLSGLSSGFKGSAVLSSSKQIVATLVQVPPSTSDVRNRPLSNGFSSGSGTVMIPTVLKNQFNTHTQFSVQNVDTGPADLTVRFYAVGSTTPITVPVTNLPSGAAKYFDMATLSNITAASFNGSAQVTAVKTGTTTPGAVVASALELSTTGTAASAFEGTTGGAGTIYMPSAFCNFGSAANITSFYAIQNVAPSGSAAVTVTYSNGKTHGPVSIAAGNKFSFSGCDPAAANPVGFIGSATVSSSGGSIVGLGKVTGNGLSTAFLGATSGATRLAAPYVRYTTTHWTDGTRQRANIAIQNVGGSLPAGSVTIKYYDKDGNLVGTDSNTSTLANGAKFSTNSTRVGSAGFEFGYYGSQIGGAALIEGPAGSQLVAVVRIETSVGSGSVGEDYNATPIP